MREVGYDGVMMGLSEAEAQRRLKQFGLNQVSEKRQWTTVKILLSQLTSPLMLVLLAAAGATGAFIGDWTDSSLILSAVGVSVTLGFFQEFKAEKALTKLKGLLAPKAKVIRDGKPRIIEARFLVPGDVAVLEIGRIVPADGKVIESDSLFINEAILTGESLPVGKQVNRLTGQQVNRLTGYQDIRRQKPANLVTFLLSSSWALPLPPELVGWK